MDSEFGQALWIRIKLREVPIAKLAPFGTVVPIPFPELAGRGNRFGPEVEPCCLFRDTSGPKAIDQNTFPIRPDGQALQEITGALTLEADTQPGAGPRLPIVELDGSQAGDGADGLLVSGGGTTISGFIINRFSGAGIRIKNEGNNAVLGNYIGTDYLGSTFLGNGTGVVIENASENRIGDTLDEIATSVDNRLRFLTSNLISGNRTDAILIKGVSSTLNHIAPITH